ncbi:MAG: hypothetical protein ACI9QC_000059 [Oceanicoccus sp.]|jgi:hypothetical protein
MNELKPSDLDKVSIVPKGLALLSAGLERSEEVLRKTRKWIERLLAVFRGDMPEEVSTLHDSLLEKSSGLDEMIGGLGALLKGEKIDSPNVDNENLLDQYNIRVRDFNEGLGAAQSNELETLQHGLLSEVLEGENEELVELGKKAGEVIEDMFTEEQKIEIREFADLIWEELFPESNVDKFAKWASGQTDLENYQEILLAPANGIEGVFSGVWDLVSSPIESYEDMVGAVDTLSGMSYADFCSCVKVMKFLYKNMDKDELVAPSISFIVGSLFIFGGASKVSKALGGRKIPGALVELLGSIGRINKESSSLARAKEMPTQLMEELDYEHILEELRD